MNRQSSTPLRLKRKRTETLDIDTVAFVKADMDASREEAQARHQELILMAQLERERDEGRMEQRRMEAKLQREKEDRRLD